MASIGFLIAFLVFSMTSPALGKFDLTFYVSCKEQHTNWCANILVYEEDTHTAHDFLAEKKICAPANDKTANMTLDFGEINPDGDNSPTYELMFLISHNCSATGETYCAKPPKALDTPAWRKSTIKIALGLSIENDTKGECARPEF